MKMQQRSDGSVHIELEKMEAETIAADPGLDIESNPELLSTTERFVDKLKDTIRFEEEDVDEDDEEDDDQPFNTTDEDDEL